MPSNILGAFLRVPADSPPPPAAGSPLATLRALLPSPRPLNPSWFLREKRSYFSFLCRAGAVFARRGCRGPSGMSAPRGTQWNGRGRAESAGDGRRRARQCHGLIFIPTSLCWAATTRPSPGLGVL